MSDVIITVGTADLRAALSSVVVHAGNDEHLPTYTRVRLLVDPVNLWVMATDRFSMGQAIVSIWEQVEPGLATIDVLPEDVKKILSIFKAGKEKADSDAPEFQVRIEADDEFVTLVDCAGFVDGRSYKIPRLPTDEQFLEIPKMISRAHHSAPVLIEELAVDGPRFARFAVAASAYVKPLLLESHTGFRSLLIRAGESFLGLLMPLNIGEEDATRNKEWSVAWSSRLPDPAYSYNHDEAAS